MPNLSFNRLTVTGDPDVIDRLFELITPTAAEAREHGCSLGIDFERVTPSPPEEFFHYKSAEGRTGMGAWFARLKDAFFEWRQPWWYRAQQWQEENWGCGNTWDYSDQRIDNAINFMTSYSPPVPLIATLSQRFPSLHLTIEYFTEGDYQYESRTFHENKEVEDLKQTLELENTPDDILCRVGANESLLFRRSTDTLTTMTESSVSAAHFQEEKC